jgi:hypothetical protein
MCWRDFNLPAAIQPAISRTAEARHRNRASCDKFAFLLATRNPDYRTTFDFDDLSHRGTYCSGSA